MAQEGISLHAQHLLDVYQRASAQEGGWCNPMDFLTEFEQELDVVSLTWLTGKVLRVSATLFVQPKSPAPPAP